MPRIENAEWKPDKRQSRYRVSLVLLRSMAIGETKRIFHDDLHCNVTTAKKNGNQPSCSLLGEIYRLRYKEGWLIESYHEADHVVVVTRIDPAKSPDYKDSRKRYGRPNKTGESNASTTKP